MYECLLANKVLAYEKCYRMLLCKSRRIVLKMRRKGEAADYKSE